MTTNKTMLPLSTSSYAALLIATVLVMATFLITTPTFAIQGGPSGEDRIKVFVFFGEIADVCVTLSDGQHFCKNNQDGKARFTFDRPDLGTEINGCITANGEETCNEKSYNGADTVNIAVNSRGETSYGGPTTKRQGEPPYCPRGWVQGIDSCSKPDWGSNADGSDICPAKNGYANLDCLKPETRKKYEDAFQNNKPLPKQKLGPGD